ncbi:MAG: AAA family ATPase [Anaerobutyricum soehngenii]
MKQVISIGKQDFASLRDENYFFIDKSNFIKEWWEAGDEITLIARPRRFGKTLNMSMLNCFFSNKYADRGGLFKGLSIWKEEKYQRIQGCFPVIFLSFADVKQTNYQDAVSKIKRIISTTVQQYKELFDSSKLTEQQRTQLQNVTPDMDDVTAQSALQELFLLSASLLLWKEGSDPSLDEYDTPMQEAYIHGYWNEFTSFIRGLFNSTFKTNRHLERAIMTGITRVSKESIFPDTNTI